MMDGEHKTNLWLKYFVKLAYAAPEKPTNTCMPVNSNEISRNFRNIIHCRNKYNLTHMHRTVPRVNLHNGPIG